MKDPFQILPSSSLTINLSLITYSCSMYRTETEAFCSTEITGILELFETWNVGAENTQQRTRFMHFQQKNEKNRWNAPLRWSEVSCEAGNFRFRDREFETHQEHGTIHPAFTTHSSIIFPAHHTIFVWHNTKAQNRLQCSNSVQGVKTRRYSSHSNYNIYTHSSL